MTDISDLLEVMRGDQQYFTPESIGEIADYERRAMAEEMQFAEKCEAFPFIEEGAPQYKVNITYGGADSPLIVGGQEYATGWADYEVDRALRGRSADQSEVLGERETEALLEQLAAENYPFLMARERLAEALEEREAAIMGGLEETLGGCGCAAVIDPPVSADEVREWGTSSADLEELNELLAEYAEELGVDAPIPIMVDYSGGADNVPPRADSGLHSEPHDAAIRRRARAEERYQNDSARFYELLAAN